MRKIIKWVLIIGLSVIALGISAFFSREFLSNYFVRLNLDTIETPNKSDRILVFAPHCDDEVLGSAELIKKTIQAGGEVKVVLITNGDGFKDAIELDYLKINLKPVDYINFGYTRQKETITALKLLGVAEKNIDFLGYPDGGISYFWNSNWANNEAFTSSYTGTNKSPYSNSYTKNAVYSGESIVKDISSIIDEYKPTHIVFPHPNDRHPDHFATNAFVKYVLATINYLPKEQLLYLVHQGDWPTPMKKNTNMNLVPPSKLINTGTTWYALPLNEDDINEKIMAINSYKTQTKALGILLSAFERKNELLGKYDDAKLPRLERQDGDINAFDGNKIIDDPLQNSITLNLNSAADISTIYAEVSKNNNLHLFIETNGNIDGEIQYNVNLFLFNGENITRLNLEVKSSTVTIKQVSKQSIKYIKGIKAQSNKKILHITIPGDGLGDYKKIFLNASTSDEDTMMDKTAWRMIINPVTF